MKYSYRSMLKLLLMVCALAFSIAGCATDQTYDNDPHGLAGKVYYDFTFDMRDSPDAEILDWWLETQSAAYTFKNELFYTKQGPIVIQATSSNGLHPKPTRLYVKWRIKSTGQEYQDTVDVGKRLPKDMEDSALTFLINGPQLSVYLATRELRPKDWPVQGPRIHKENKVLHLYPDQPQPAQ